MTFPACTIRQAVSTSLIKSCHKSNTLLAKMCSNTLLTSTCSINQLRSQPHYCHNLCNLLFNSLMRLFRAFNLSTIWAKTHGKICLNIADPQWRSTFSASYTTSYSVCISTSMSKMTLSLKRFKQIFGEWDPLSCFSSSVSAINSFFRFQKDKSHIKLQLKKSRKFSITIILLRWCSA